MLAIIDGELVVWPFKIKTQPNFMGSRTTGEDADGCLIIIVTIGKANALS